MKKGRLWLLLVALLVSVSVMFFGCGGENKDTTNTEKEAKTETTETKNENISYEYLNEDKDLLILAKGKDTGIAAVSSTAKKDKDGILAIDVIGFLTSNNETISEDKWYFRKKGNIVEFSSHQKSFGQKWEAVDASDITHQNAFDVASKFAEKQSKSVVYTPNQETKKQTEAPKIKEEKVNKEKETKEEPQKQTQKSAMPQKEYSKWQCGQCARVVTIEGNDKPPKSGCTKSRSGNHEWLLMKKHIKQ